MRKEVLVTVTGTQTSEEGEEDTIKLVTTGSYFQKKSSYYIVLFNGICVWLRGIFNYNERNS